MAAQAAASSFLAPCDIYAAGGTPCVAAYSTVRALYRSYRGPLYQVTRVSDGTTANIGTLPDGYADAAAQNSVLRRHGVHHHQDLRPERPP